MSYSSISIQGNIFTSEILEKIRTEDTRFQKSIDFGINSNIRDEINLVWSIAITNWNVFKQKRDQLSETDSATTETRKYWIIPLFSALGYEISTSNAEIINSKSYAISHRVNNKEGFPIHIVGLNQSLDKRAESGGTRLSPHALVQEYVNNTEHLYGLVTNGRFLRLLRDATRLSRLSYLEFDLEQIMEDSLYSEFALLYRLLHVSRLPSQIDFGSESILEFYHLEAISSGSRIRERLSIAVEVSIKELANGILKYSTNENIREKIINNEFTAKEYYLYILRLVYRILFLLVIEERKLIYPDKRDESLNKLRGTYYEFYSIQRLTQLSVKMVYIDPKKSDLWQSLMTTFSIFELSSVGNKLGISSLGSGLFSPNALGEISNQLLDNECLLKVIRNLVTFVNENGQLVRVNYADLDVEEFGSVYEGLLDYDPIIIDNMGQPAFAFIAGGDRSSSGSHYTPEELVKPLITHSLDYLIADSLKDINPEKALLKLKVCDVACGSGHILLSAARRIGFELAKYRSNEDQPTPTVLRTAIRDVIKNCIYGVDLNPLAVELCKVALWLEAHEPGEPLNFLDHHIKNGNAIIGLAHRNELEIGIPNEAFKTLTGDDKNIAKVFRDKNIKERKQRAAKVSQLKADFEKATDDSLKTTNKEFMDFNNMPENTPEEIESKGDAYKRFIDGEGVNFLKAMADTMVAQFFISKTAENKDVLMTDADFILILSGNRDWQDRKVAKAKAVAIEERIFHWFIEFPEVFSEGGFDCILGNPPFLGGQKLSGSFGDPFLESIKYQFAPIGAVDLVTYFFRRIYTLIKQSGFQSLISTNTIAQGKAREEGLDIIVKQGGSINHAVKSTKWPGVAAVEVALVTITKQPWKGKFYIGTKEVNTITPYLDDAETIGNPFPLKQNEGKSFQGSIVLGKGFVLEPEEAETIITNNPKNKDVLFPYLNGDDLNNNPDQSPSRWVINFFDWEERKAKNYPDCYEIVERLVKPERQRWAVDKEGNEIAGEYALRKPLPEKWWIYGEKRPGLYKELTYLKTVLVVAKTAKYIGVSLVNSKYVLDQSLTIGIYDKFSDLSIIQSSICDQFVKAYGTTMETRFRFNIEALETYPFPKSQINEQIHQLENIGKSYHEHRTQLMLDMQLGLTKTYNLFHNNEIAAQSVNEKDKQVVALQKYLAYTPNTISLDESIRGIRKLRELHIKMDEAVLDAYGWNDINLCHDFYEVDYLPENDRIRFTIHPEARKEVLKRLLELNHKIHEEEIQAEIDSPLPKKKSKSSKVKNQDQSELF
jgi:hypothetical protein